MQVHPYEGPEECKGQRHPHDSGFERRCKTYLPDSGGDVAQKRNQNVRDHANRDRQANPLRETRHEAEVRMQRTADVHVTPASARHR